MIADDGGPAFPGGVNEEYTNLDKGVPTQGGMSLREYFAAHEPIDPNDSIGVALAERLTGRSCPKSSTDPLDLALFWADAEAAYRYLRADAMLRARRFSEFPPKQEQPA